MFLIPINTSAVKFVLVLLTFTINSIFADKLAKTWVIHTDPDLKIAAQIAQEHNFKIVKPIDLQNKGYYVVESDHHRFKRSSESETLDMIQESAKNLKNHPNVNFFEQERVLKRMKRDFRPQFNSFLDHRQRNRQRVSLIDSQVQNFFGNNKNEDPEWINMWYLNRHLYNPSLPDMNVTGAWAQGFSGKGVSVTFLDDGLEYTHPDIQENYDPKASYDINSNDDDPIPRYDHTNENKHGTRCAGEVAATANNSICSVGVAYHAGIGGIRMLDGDVTDSVEARSLVFNRHHVDIYSASWGPDDNGQVVDGPGPLAKQAFSEGVKLGRQGLGSIFVWASGNGGRFNDSCACDGYANSIYTLSISSTSESSEKPWYLEECTSTLATTYSSGDSRNGDREIATTDLRHKCTTQHTGTSAAAPIAAGIVALCLEANPRLTWRDLMYLTVMSSRPKAIKTNNYIENKRGFLVSSRYGFGLMDAGRMVELAKKWINVPDMSTCSTQSGAFQVENINHGKNIIDASIATNACQGSSDEVNYIEQVELIVTIKADIRGSVEVYLTSPMGTNSLILARRMRDKSRSGFKKWAFMTVQLWGESPRGHWRLHVSTVDGSRVELVDFTLRIHGTKLKPAEYERNVPAMKQVTCHYECKQAGASCGPTEYDCTTCAHFSLKHEDNQIECVSYCPRGYFANNSSSSCNKCNSGCSECNGPAKTDCVTCENDKFMNLETHECLTKCPDGYFINSKRQCQECSKNCLTCEFESDHCTSCQLTTNSTIQLRHNRCTIANACTTGSYYDSENNRCQFCDITCLACSSTKQTSCIACLVKRPFLSEGSCVATCSDTRFKKDKNCFQCAQGCTGCNGDTFNCTGCLPGYALTAENRCELFVPSECNDDCYECTRKDFCNVCKNGFASLNGTCTENPPDGFFKKKHSDQRGNILTMTKCDTSCLKCTDHNVCQLCKENSLLSNHKCIPNCKPGFHATISGDCIACDSSCTTCLDAQTCLTCPSSKKLFKGQCMETCPLNFYSSADNICHPCYPSCETCSGPGQTKCLTCVKGFNYNKNHCMSQCPEGTFYNSTADICDLCNANKCSRCLQNADMCTGCITPLALDVTGFVCKPCCVRSVHGSKNDIDCCACGVKDSGVCSGDHQSYNDSNVDSQSLLLNGMHHHKKATNNLIIVVSVFLILLAVAFTLFSVSSYIQMFFNRVAKKNFNKVEYSPLNENLEIS